MSSSRENYAKLRLVIVAMLASVAAFAMCFVRRAQLAPEALQEEPTPEVVAEILNPDDEDGSCSIDLDAPPQPPPPATRSQHPQVGWQEAAEGPGDVLLSCRELRQLYPVTTPLGEALRAWNPNESDPPPFNEALKVFDGTNPEDMALAEVYRNCELPFKVRNAPEIAATVARWTDSYLLAAFEDPANAAVGSTTHRSESNHFMYWKKFKSERVADYTPPTAVIHHCGFEHFLPLARLADERRLPPESPHVYLAVGSAPTVPKRVPGSRKVNGHGRRRLRGGTSYRAGAVGGAINEAAAPAAWQQRRRRLAPGRSAVAAAAAMAAAAAGGGPADFIAADLPYFSTPVANFWVTDVVAQKGIQCRFGMRGVLAESHYDSGRNFVVMLRGEKRYILNPPEACPALGIITETSHPSFRHSAVDWTDERAWPQGFADAPTIDTIVHEGEALYIPSYWFHFVQSLGFSIQCNARSGPPPGGEGFDDVKQCG